MAVADSNVQRRPAGGAKDRFGHRTHGATFSSPGCRLKRESEEKEGERRGGSSVPPLSRAARGRTCCRINVVAGQLDLSMSFALSEFAVLNGAALCAARVEVSAAVSSSKGGIWGVSDPQCGDTGNPRSLVVPTRSESGSARD